MSKAYTEELVYIQSEDGFLLEGAVVRPSATPAQPIAVIWTHGLTGRFCTPPVVTIGRELASRGYAFVTGNNRGHDFGAVLRRGMEVTIGGGGWELFEESPRDVAAWVGFAAGLGFRGVALLGHSLGGLKVAYYQAERQDPRVLGLVAASPPLRAGRSRPELVKLAEQMLAQGKGQDLLPWGISPAGAGTVSAQTLLSRLRTNIDVYGFETPNPAVARVTCPIFAFYGTNEEWVGGASDLEVIKRSAVAAPRVDTRMFEGADHSYFGYEPEVAAALAEWVSTLL